MGQECPFEWLCQECDKGEESWRELLKVNPDAKREEYLTSYGWQEVRIKAEIKRIHESKQHGPALIVVHETVEPSLEAPLFGRESVKDIRPMEESTSQLLSLPKSPPSPRNLP